MNSFIQSQAADILLYKATHVPVGSDQKQHLEFAGNLVTAFNYRFPLQNGEGLFPKPQALMPEHGFAKVKSLRNPLKKMSKSEVSAKGRVELLDSADVVKDKIMKAVTDFTSEVYFDLKERPGVSNLMSIHSMISGKTLKEITDESRGMETAQYKKLVGEELDAHLRPIRDEALRLLEGSSNVLDDVLADGASRAKKVAQNTWSEVRELIGAIGCGSPSSVKKERSVA
ncbi:unnamed protein product [Cyprideis torosa]|uniref:tryptophan--tRNA ligase n=1 Tax=Cyprideis torosa TaxID=163714 RepID=A0A7R8W7T5_9CRUS|nr:unnamed protein product [Cyprideis torosa]CAG0882517.1 unnamed protein product [Cyprideis torosa]